VAPSETLNKSINNAQKHYSSLFSLPTLKKAVLLLFVICLANGFSTVSFSLSFEEVIQGFSMGILFFFLTIACDLFISKILLDDPIFTSRRTIVLSLFNWFVWFFFIIIGLVFSVFIDYSWWAKFCLLGFSVVLTLRAVVLFVVSSSTFMKKLAAIVIQPFVCIAAIGFLLMDSQFRLDPLLLFLLPFLAVGFAFLFVYLLDNVGQKKQIPSMLLFKAFLLNWITSKKEPLEAFLEKMGTETDVIVSILKFDSAKPKAAIILPLVHPGPFKNIGSSVLPSLLKLAYERETGCTACVPLGLLGHELNAASQAQNKKIIEMILNASRFETKISQATPFVRVSAGFVAASCQVFGNTAFMSFTLAPKTTEDLPQELGSFISEESRKLGLKYSIVVNSHNSITENVRNEASLSELKEVAVKCLKETVSKELTSFEIGAATVYANEFSLKDGMGPGGITAIIVKVAQQKTAYIVIDGNNMISGLREKILSSLSSEGFDESEVFTTDTHAVSAVVLGSRGYHPIGESMNTALLISYVKKASQLAVSSIERCTAGSIVFVVPKVKVMGEDFLESLSLLVDETIGKAKQIVIPIFALEGLLLLLLLSFL
jgi:putative membrane protein